MSGQSTVLDVPDDYIPLEASYSGINLDEIRKEFRTVGSSLLNLLSNS